MIRYSEIPSGVVGLRDSTISGYDVVNAVNQATSSGLYFQDFSKFITVQNLKDTQQDSGISDDNFNTYLTNAAKAAFIKIVNAVFRDNSQIENDLLFKYENRVNELLTNDTSFVGYEITLPPRKDITVILNRIITEFSGTGNVKVLLFNSTLQTAVESETINHNLSLSAVNTSVNWNLPVANSINGGKWYVGYLRNGLSVQAIDRDYNNASIASIFKCFSIRPIKVDGWNAETLFDVDDVVYTDETYGLNFDLSSYYDQTSWVVQNKNEFAEAIGYQYAIDAIEQMIASVRSNEIQRLNINGLLTELGGLSGEGIPTVQGLNAKLTIAVNKLRKKYQTEKDNVQITTLR